MTTFLVTWVISSLMPIGPIITGVVIILHEPFSNAWIVLFNRISGENTDRLIFFRGWSIIFGCRASEILFSCTQLRKDEETAAIDDRLSLLVTTRRYLGLFQHHDGITGTARDHVVDNYGQKYFQILIDFPIVVLLCLDFYRPFRHLRKFWNNPWIS